MQTGEHYRPRRAATRHGPRKWRERQLEAALAVVALVLAVPWLWGVVGIVRMVLWGTP